MKSHSAGLSVRAEAGGGHPRSSDPGSSGCATHFSSASARHSAYDTSHSVLYLCLPRKAGGGFPAPLLAQTVHLRKNKEQLVKGVKQKPKTKKINSGS